MSGGGRSSESSSAGAATAAQPDYDALRDRKAREVERVIELAAPVTDVWHALTDAHELARWFPQRASVTPGAGGAITMWWGDEPVTQQIEIWEPNRRLRTIEQTAGWSGIVYDHFLEARGGTTVLRVVSSGFDGNDDWEDLLAGTATGWDFELRGLQLYLERHRGTDRVVAVSRAKHGLPYAEAFRRLTSRGGCFAGERTLDDDLRQREPGEMLQIVGHNGETIDAEVVLWQPPRQVVASLPGGEWNDGLFRLELYSNTATLWLSTYGVPGERVARLESSWRSWLDSLLSD